MKRLSPIVLSSLFLVSSVATAAKVPGNKRSQVNEKRTKARSRTGKGFSKAEREKIAAKAIAKLKEQAPKVVIPKLNAGFNYSGKTSEVTTTEKYGFSRISDVSAVQDARGKISVELRVETKAGYRPIDVELVTSNVTQKTKIRVMVEKGNATSTAQAQRIRFSIPPLAHSKASAQIAVEYHVDQDNIGRVGNVTVREIPEVKAEPSAKK